MYNLNNVRNVTKHADSATKLCQHDQSGTFNKHMFKTVMFCYCRYIQLYMECRPKSRNAIFCTLSNEKQCFSFATPGPALRNK